MSHIAKVSLEIKDLDAFARACTRCGVEFLRDVSEFRYYRGKKAPCEHAVRVNSQAYEMGLRREAKGGWSLVADFYMGGMGLVDKVGEGAKTLKQFYAVEASKSVAQRRGFTVQERWSSGKAGVGSVELIATKR